jgi:hypothetical protein
MHAVSAKSRSVIPALAGAHDVLLKVLDDF